MKTFGVCAATAAFALLMSSCGTNQQQATEEMNVNAPLLTEAWATEPVLKTPESVLYHAPTNAIYVANINGNATEKDGNGFISKLSLTGEILELEWATGLDAPKGMGIAGDWLYVTDIDRIVVFDLATGEKGREWIVSDAQFLNDISVSPEREVFISDMRAAKLLRLDGDDVEVVKEGEELERLNGLYAEGNGQLVVAAGDFLKTINLADGTVTTRASGLTAGDGVAAAGGGRYVVSQWNGEVFWVNEDWSLTKLLDTREQKINSADIDYVPSEKLLLVPTFLDNRVVAYKLSMP